MNFDGINFVLNNTSHPGNIGAVARAMKTMGFHHLRLVEPKRFPDVEATNRASGATDVLEQAGVFNHFNEAISDCHCVVGTSSRVRTMGIPTVSPRELSEIVAEERMQQRQVAIVFGTERYGMTNEQLASCHYHVIIPANPEYCSLNLASAAQLIAYELRCALMASVQNTTALSKQDKQQRLATDAEMQGFYQHLEQTMIDIGFLNPDNPRHLMSRIKRLYNRARPSETELNILRGILSLTQKRIDN